MKIPITKQIAGQLSQISDFLEPQALQELIVFVKENQNLDGGFINRGGESDPYYSFFGYLISSGLGLTLEMGKLRRYISDTKNMGYLSMADECAMVIMDSLLNDKRGGLWPKAFRLIYNYFLKGNRESSHNLFLLLLVLDTVLGRTTIWKPLIRRIIKKMEANEIMPCSQVSALLVLKRELRLPGEQEITLLSRFFIEEGGFKIYPQMTNADMLSTAVAMFALKHSGADLRLFVPSVMRFVEKHYLKGAFLSGDGDTTRDLEYTFYGMLALTSVVRDKGTES